MIDKKFRFIGIVVALLLFGFITTSFISYYVAHDTISSQIEETTLPLTSDNIYSEIQRDLLNPIFISSLMAQDTFVRDWVISGENNPDEMLKYLSEIQKRYNAVTCFFVSDYTGKYYHPRGILKVVDQEDPLDEWYFRVANMKTDYEINIDTDTADGESLNIFINYRVFDFSGNFIGVTGIGLAVSSVKDLINTYQSRYGRRVYFINREGDIALSCEDSLMSPNIRNEPGLSILATQILTSPGFSGSYEHNGKTVFLNSRLVPEFDWYLIVEQMEDPSEKRIQNTFLINLSVSLIITLIVLFLVNLTYGKYQRKLEEMATTDNLTGVANRQIFDLIFEQSLKVSVRRKEPLSAIMFDIDNFKSINDSFGHPAGDLVLRELINTVKTQIRDTDILCRWGGDEFLLILPDCNLDQAEHIAEKIRQKTEIRIFNYRRDSFSVTSSFGVTQMEQGDNQYVLIKKVDDALYRAKEKGKNRVEL